MKQLLNRVRSVDSSDKISSLNIDIQRSEKLMPLEHSEVTVNLYQLYLEEREKADKYRLIFSIYPVCTNVLHNMNTEIVRDEGSTEVMILSDTGQNISSKCDSTPYNSNYTGLTRQQAIEDTEYSHTSLGHFVYHCGRDIFNNHTLRQAGYTPLIKSKNTSSSSFNTLGDMACDSDGNTIEETTIGASASSTQSTAMHKYNHDNVYSFSDAMVNNLVEKDGWVGFYNPSTTPFSLGTNTDKEDIFVNKCMNNNKPCEFYDMYPDRELYSFIPKVNYYRNGREEKNWEYCLTYPARMSYDYHNCNLVYDRAHDIHGILAVETGYLSNHIYIHTGINHGMEDGDEIRIYYSYDGSYFGKLRATVNSIGDPDGEDEKHWISIMSYQVSGEWESDDDGNITIPNIVRITKYSDGCEHDYYFREFRKIPNINNLNKDFTDEEILSEAMITTANEGKPYKSVIGKMGFARTIYGDLMSQLIFNEDVNVKHILDYRGRKISEIYLTIIKNNKGYYEWYHGHPESANVQYSHCFGLVSAGFDMPMSATTYDTLSKVMKDYNIHCLHNVDTTDSSVSALNIPTSGKKLADNITIDDEYFIGDIVDWNPYQLTETILENAKYRFNTYQREDLDGSDYTGVTYNELDADDLDTGTDGSSSGFKITTNTYTTGGTRGNIFPEGYYYQPHYKILLREFDDSIEEYLDTQIVYSNCYKYSDDQYMITTSIPYAIDINDVLTIRFNNSGFTGTIVDMYDAQRILLKIDSDLYALISKEDLDPIVEKDAEIYMKNIDLPKGAQYVPDGKGTYHYKDFKAYYSSDSEQLQNATFTNDALYLENEVVFFLRRQDPFGVYHLNYTYENGVGGNLAELSVIGDALDVDTEKYKNENDMSECK